MKITRETDHATKCVLFLSRSPNQLIPVNEIAKKNDIPRSFLAKILQKLTKAGIVTSQQGNQGGFQLLRSPQEISLYDIFVTIQGEPHVNGCVVDHKFCNRVNFCSVHPVWVTIREEIVNKLKGINFSMLYEQEQALRNENPFLSAT